MIKLILKLSLVKRARGKKLQRTPVVLALQGPTPISLQTHIDHKNNSFVQYNAALRSMASASETIDADDFIKEFNFLQGKQ